MEKIGEAEMEMEMDVEVEEREEDERARHGPEKKSCCERGRSGSVERATSRATGYMQAGCGWSAWSVV